MKKQVLFIQGAGEGAHEEDSKLVASLQKTLGVDYEVRYPTAPDEDDPDPDAWMSQIEREIAASDGPIILAGHSVGGYILLKYLSERGQSNKPIPGIFIIAAPYPGGDENWHFEGFSLPENFGAKLPANTKIFLYHSPDDQTVPFAHLALYGKALPKALVRQTSGGHQLNNDLSIVAKDIIDL